MHHIEKNIVNNPFLQYNRVCIIYRSTTVKPYCYNEYVLLVKIFRHALFQ